MFSAVSVRALGPKCFKSRKLVTLEILSKYVSLWFRNGAREGWQGGARRNCHQSIVNTHWIARQRRCFNMEKENCSVLSRIDNMTIVHWKGVTAVALELRARGRMNECYKFFQNGPLFHKSPSLPQINTRQLFTVSANLASLYKATCYPWPQSANVKSPLGGFAAAGKCQVKMPCKIYTALQQRKGQEIVKCPCPDVCELRSAGGVSEFLVPGLVHYGGRCASDTNSLT